MIGDYTGGAHLEIASFYNLKRQNKEKYMQFIIGMWSLSAMCINNLSDL